jgi:perosamine synthetase
MSDFIPQAQPWFDERETEAVTRYMRGGGWLTEFKETKRFGEMIAEFTGARYCSILANGTVSLTAALLAMEIGPGDEVVVPAYTMVATANAVAMANGAKPIFADVERETMGLDCQSFVDAVTPRTKAAMLVSINGRYPRRLDAILDFCKQRQIRVVEDAAQSLGSRHRGKHAGTFGDVGSFSFSMPKIITTGQGGALITDDGDLFHKIELVRNFGREEAGVDRHVFFGANFKFTDLQAVIGIEQLKKIEARVTRKKEIYRTLRDRLAGTTTVRFFDTDDGVAPWFNDVLVEDRDALAAHLKQRGVGTRPFYPVVPTQAPYHRPDGEFPNAEYVSRHGLWLPSFAQLSDPEIDRIVEGVATFGRR